MLNILPFKLHISSVCLKAPAAEVDGIFLEVLLYSDFSSRTMQNKEGSQHMFKRINLFVKFWAIAGCATLALWIIPGTSFAEIGKIRINSKVAANFESYRANSNYNYYYANLENNPCAVIGLRKEYNVDNILWTLVRPGTEEFKKVVELVRRFPMSNSPAFGGYILDAKGSTIGEYYSSAGAGVVVNDEARSVLLTIFMAGYHHN